MWWVLFHGEVNIASMSVIAILLFIDTGNGSSSINKTLIEEWRKRVK